MIQLINNHRQALKEICQKHRVRKLELFGSAATGEFDPQASDIDMLVEFEALPEGQRADHYFGLQEELKSVLGRPIDLVMVRAIKNIFFLEAIANQRELLYAA